MKNLNYIFITLLSCQLSVAQNTKIDMVAENWLVPPEATFEMFDGRETLVLKSGRATVKNTEFSNGTIEVDVYANTIRSFAGITFRKKGPDMEEVYMRLHKSNQVDAVQYTPIFNNESNWQLFREHQAKVSFKNVGWNTLRLEVNGGQVEVFVNDERAMSVSPLVTDVESGEIGLFALFGNRFSNFSFTPKEATGKPEKAETGSADPSIITQWKITDAKLYQESQLDYEDFLAEEYITVPTEASGLLPISKYIKKTTSGNFEQNSEDYIVATTTILSDGRERKILSFDYSDKILLYLNGRLLFKGNNAFRAKGVQYMGHMGIDVNKLYLDLEKGENILHCVVIDKANGWGLMAKLE